MKNTDYICEGTCQAEISEEEYRNGLTKCGAKKCTHFHKPFTKVEDMCCGNTSSCCSKELL